MPEVLTLAQYYYAAAAGTLIGLDPATSEIIRVRQETDPSVELDGSRTLVVGRFLQFDAAKRILTSESGVQISLPTAAAEKSRTLKEATKAWLTSLIR